MIRIPHKNYTPQPIEISDTLRAACLEYQEAINRSTNMTSNKTTALIEHVAKALFAHDLCERDVYGPQVYENRAKVVLEALAAFEQPQERRAENGGGAHGSLIEAAKLACGNTHMYLNDFLNGDGNKHLREDAVAYLSESNDALYEALAAFEQPEQEHPASLSKEAQPASMQHAAPVDAQSGGGCERRVRVMSVEEVVNVLHPFFQQHDRSWVNIEDAAKALAKLGTIRVVEG